VRCVAPLVLDFAMKSRDLFNLVTTTIRTALFGREFTLGSCEVLSSLGSELLALFAFAITRSNLVHDSEIDANFAAGSLQRHRGHVHAVHVQPPLGALTLHGNRLRITGERPVKVSLDLANPLQIKASVVSFQFPATTISPLE
jgi:hypothetical protein